MKKQLLFLLITILSINCYSQINFEKGYFINNSDQKIDCLIKNIAWKNNPTQITYKLSEDGEQKTANLESVKEFGIYNNSKYVRATVNIDISSRNVRDLSHVEDPIFQKKEVFLKVMLEGKANLYSYEDGNLERYFFKKDNDPIEQLIFKEFKTTDNKIGVNNGFKQQLWDNLKCNDTSVNSIKNIDYNGKELLDYFVKYNQCSGSEFTTFKQTRDLFNLTLRPGIKSSSLSISNSTSNISDIDFEDELGLRLGVELEFIMPFNKNKWAFIIEPTYQYYESEKTKTSPLFAATRNIIYNVDYESIELPIGIRHYFFLNKNSKIFINGSVVIDFVIGNSNIKITDSFLGQIPKVLEIETGINAAFGLGYKHNDKYSLELRYLSDRDLFNDFLFWESEYSSLSLIFGYTLF